MNCNCYFFFKERERKKGKSASMFIVFTLIKTFFYKFALPLEYEKKLFAFYSLYSLFQEFNANYYYLLPQCIINKITETLLGCSNYMIFMFK